MKYLDEILIVSALIGQLILVNAAFAYQNSTIICIPNSTGLNTSDVLQENITVVKDGNQTNLTLNTRCQYGCSNVTSTCNPPTFEQNLIVFGLIIGLCALGFLFMRWSR